MFVGAHVSIAGGIWNAPKNGHDWGCEVIQIFTRPPQGGKAPELTPEIIKKFKLKAKSYNLKVVYIHAPYFINLASINNRIRYGSVKVIREELERGSLIGAKYVMTHLGTGKDLGHKEAMKKTVEMLKKSLEGYAGDARLLLENSAGAGEIIGDDLKELARILRDVGSSKIAGICLDTQHSFASGYDWTDFEKTLERVDREIGAESIKLIHANDSQSDCGSNKDRHEHIGQGKIGLPAFKNIAAFAQKNNISMICETEYPGVEEDIKLLKNLRN
jgi:deoxyribonuclease IV